MRTALRRGAVCACALMLWAGLSTAEAGKPSDQESLRLEARIKHWRTLGNVFRRAGVEDAFLLADRYTDQGRDEDAIRLYAEALQVDSWRFDKQLKLARLLAAHARADEAAQKAGEIARYAHDESLASQAEALLQQLGRPPADRSAPPSVPPGPLTDAKLILVPVGPVHAHLLEELRLALSWQLGLHCEIRAQSIPLPGADRPYADAYLDQMWRAVGPTPGETAWAILGESVRATLGMGSRHIRRSDLLEAVLRARRQRGESEAFRDTFTQLATAGQYDTGKLLATLKLELPPPTPPLRGYLGVTGADLFAPGTHFVFGSATPGFGIMSSFRFFEGANGMPLDAKTVEERAIKQAISSTFFLLNIPRCTSAGCVRAYAHSLEEHDRKGMVLCEWCRRQLQDALSGSGQGGF